VQQQRAWAFRSDGSGSEAPGPITLEAERRLSDSLNSVAETSVDFADYHDHGSASFSSAEEEGSAAYGIAGTYERMGTPATPGTAPYSFLKSTYEVGAGGDAVQEHRRLTVDCCVACRALAVSGRGWGVLLFIRRGQRVCVS
jgi:hypothetical protein